MTMKEQLAFVLGGGGARGALQAGAIRALLEHDCRPNLLVGTSVGAVNAAFLAIRGLSLEGVDALDAAWRQAARQDLLPSNYVWRTLRSMLRTSGPSPSSRIRDFFVANGVSPQLRFADIGYPRLIIVSSDLNTGQPLLHGLSPEDSVLEALLTSTALPPWAMPVKQQGRYLMDGGAVSALPVEAALKAGASRIIALDLTDPRDAAGQANGFGVFLTKLTYAVEQRQVDLELELARARGIEVFCMHLRAAQHVPIWDFRHTQELINAGYESATCALAEEAGKFLSVE